MRVKKWLALCLALMMLCCGWAQGEENESILAVVNGVALPLGETEIQFIEMAQMYREDGCGDEEIEHLKQELMEERVMNELLRQKAAELGLTQFPEQELEVFRNEASNQYEAMLSFYMDFFTEENLTDAQIREKTIAYFEESGYTIDSIVQEALEDAALDRLYDLATSSVIMTDEELKVYYDERVAADRETYTANLYSFEYALGGESVVTYIPEGFRAVYALLVRFSDADVSTMYGLLQQRNKLMMNEKPDAGMLEQLNAQIDAIIASVQPTLDTIRTRLADGEDFKALMKAFNEDVGMETEPFASNGYYVCADSVVWPTEFVEAAMALTQVGQVSEPIVLYNGVCFLYYAGEVTPGAVPIESIRNELMREAMDVKREDAYREALNEWRAQAQVVTYPEMLVEAKG